MRIAMIGSRGLGSNYGGVERCLDALCPHLTKLGHEVDVFAGDEFKELSPCEGARNIPVASIGGKHLSNLSRSTLAAFRAMGRYDVLHFHATGPGVLTLLTRLAGQVSVATVHALDQDREKWGFAARKALCMAERVLVHSANELTVVSAKLSDYFVREHNRHVKFIPNGVAAPTPVGSSAVLRRLNLRPKEYMLFAGRMTPEKGCHDLIEAFNRAETSLKLLIAGGNGSAEYIERVHRLANPSRVLFAGHLEGDDLAAAFANAHSFALPSYIEGMSLSLLEAISNHLPLLVSDIPENRAVCADSALYFQAGQVNELRVALEHLCALPSPVLQYQVDSTRLPKWSDVAREYETVYTLAVSTRGRGVHAGLPKLR